MDALAAETATLVIAWSKNTIHSHLLGSKRNTEAFEKIVEALAVGVDRHTRFKRAAVTFY